MTCKPLFGVLLLCSLLAACGAPPAARTPIPAVPNQDIALVSPAAVTLVPGTGAAPTVAVSTAAPPAPTPGATITPAKTQVIVRPGDTLFGIAQRYHVSMATIQLINNLGDSDLLRAGQTLDIPSSPLWDGESTFWVVHVVRSGETLTGIGETYGLSTREILRVNAIADPAMISPGQPIVIPLDSLQVAPPPTSPPTARPTARPSPLPTATAPVIIAAAQPSATSRAPAPTAIPTPRVAPTSAPLPGDIAAWPATVVALINQKRAAHGLPLYTIAPALMQAAQAHADDCSAHGWCGHSGSDGSDTKTRFIRAGYNNPAAWGENWIQTFDPIKAVEWWYDEPPGNDPHRRNLLNTRYTEVGIGVAKAANGYYFIANFGAR